MNDDTVLQLVVIGFGAVAIFWLIVLPYRLSKGLVHKWGYHAYCGNSCEIGLSASHVKAQLAEQYRAGMRQGMRGRTTFGDKQSTEMVAKYSLLPEWTKVTDDSAFLSQVKDKYDEVRFAFDTTDDVNIAGTALAVALGVVVKQCSEPWKSYDAATDLVANFAGLTPMETQPS